MWRETTLGEVLSIKHGWAFKGEFFASDGEEVVLTPGNFPIGGGLQFRQGKERFYTGPYPSDFRLSAGDLLVVMTDLKQDAPILGSPAFVPKQPTVLHNQRLGLVKIKNSAELDVRFLYYLLLSDETRRQLRATATGSTVRHTAPSRIYQVKVRLPPPAEQRSIARVLGALDGQIENNRRRTAVLEEMARAIYREWFIHFRYPDFEDVPLVASRCGPIPDGWMVAELQSVAKVNRRSRTPTKDEVIRYLDISALGDRTVGSLEALYGAVPGRARRVVEPGDVVWSMVRPGRRAHALLVDPGPDWIASTGMAVLSATRTSSTWLFETTSTEEFSDYLVSRESGAAYPAVKPKDFERAPVVVPPPGIDQLFAQRVAPMHRLCWSLRTQSDKLMQFRDVLLPRLVTGGIDVARLDIEALSEAVIA